LRVRAEAQVEKQAVGDACERHALQQAERTRQIMRGELIGVGGDEHRDHSRETKSTEPLGDIDPARHHQNASFKGSVMWWLSQAAESAAATAKTMLPARRLPSQASCIAQASSRKMSDVMVGRSARRRGIR